MKMSPAERHDDAAFFRSQMATPLYEEFDEYYHVSQVVEKRLPEISCHLNKLSKKDISPELSSWAELLC